MAAELIRNCTKLLSADAPDMAYRNVSADFCKYLLLRRDYSHHVVVCVVIIYAIMFVVGTVGNIMVIIAVIRKRRMQTVTNIFITELAISDLLILSTCLPFTISSLYITQEWIYGEALCRIVMFSQTLATYTSIFTLTAMSLERYYMLVHPIKARAIWTRSTAVTVACALFMLAAVCALPRALLSTLMTAEHDGHLYMPYCAEEVPSMFLTVYAALRVSLCFIVPLAVITALYAKIGCYLRRHHSGLQQHDSNFCAQIVARRKITKMLLTMVALFFACWILLNVYFVVIATPRGFEFLVSEYSDYYLFAMFFLIYGDCVCNPIVYSFMSTQFQREFKNMVCRWRHGDYAKRTMVADSLLTERDSFIARRDSCVPSSATRKASMQIL